ncbi:hypothetical protein RHGRI_036962 [Rhododendron griersonianum]|uniref:Lecithin-cholesterol acyltransferase-like 4 n=1 Tax=Rhododendron griersonianum TaxID=479676 RepID=A0AAV6HQH3_9ERIC|nr:hypothetical protein RHGRI_036962 [Rhododendron griersonianum]
MVMLLEDIVESVELWLKLIRKKPQPYVDPDLDPVLLVPGIAGSILKAVDDEGREERVWVRILSADYKCRTKLWSLFDPSTGKTVSLDPKSNISVPEDRDGLYAIDILDPDLVIGRDCVYYFHDMIVEMIKWGFQEGKTLFGFGYDFRQSNRCQETLELLAAKMETVFTASGGKKLTIITHSMGGLLVKCFMCLHSDIFEKYVKSWIAIAAPFQGAPGYVTSTFVNGMSFVEGWEQNFFISKWSMHQLLLECPSFYELMACPDFCWENSPLLQIWKQNCDSDGNSNILLESYSPEESISIFTEALSTNTVKYDGVDIPLPFNLEILKWANETRKVLSSAKLPPQVKFYNVYGTNLETPHSVCYGSEGAPVTDLQQLPSLMANYVCVDGDGTVPVESAKVTSLKEEWEIIGEDQDNQETGAADRKPLVSSISVSNVGDEKSMREEARATIIVHPLGEGRQHVELNASIVYKTILLWLPSKKHDSFVVEAAHIEVKIQLPIDLLGNPASCCWLHRTHPDMVNIGLVNQVT